MPTKTFSKILVATDFSEESDTALQAAIDVARQFNARLEIVHVLEVELEPFGFGALATAADNGVLLNSIDRQLAARADQARRAGVTCETTALEGKPDVEIVRRANDTGADLVVVGTHGRTGLAHVVMGSVAERVVQHARRPVLAVPFARKAA
jgi:nucleotide-binding universal stress UspA family protein